MLTQLQRPLPQQRQLLRRLLPLLQNGMTVPTPPLLAIYNLTVGM
jgi:hypothetical protein